MRISFSQLNPIIGDFEHNVEKIIQAIKRAKEEKADLVIFPEMAICGYPAEDLLHYSGFVEKSEQSLEEILPHTDKIAVIVGLARRSDNGTCKPLCNSAAVIANKKILGFQDKALLPTYDVFDERRHFRPAPTEIVWEIAQKRVGVTICEDIWAFSGVPKQECYPLDPITYFENQKVDLLVNISASPFSVGRIDTRRQVAIGTAQRVKAPLVLVNQVGGQDGLIFDGSSFAVSAHGELLFQAKSFAEDFVTIDLAKLHPLPIISEEEPQEIFSALSLGLHDYFTKQGFQKACVGLSGGIDSALTAAIATRALGKENVLGVLLPSRYTSPESTEDALYVASNLGIDTIEVSIEKSFHAIEETLKPIFDGKPVDVTEENIQSRVRGLLLMAISNKEQYLLLNTGNKSEIAVGYTTLYGDSCGAISVIGDLLKTQVYQVSEWIRHEFGWIPERVIKKEPTAELRPNQKDSDSIPEYHILDSIIEDYVVNMLCIDEIVKKRKLAKKLVEEVIQKIEAAEYKRRQLPFALRVTDKAFACGRKVPIVHKY